MEEETCFLHLKISLKIHFGECKNMNKIENIDLNALLDMRSQIYFTLSRAFAKEVDKEFLEQLSNNVEILKNIALSSNDEAFIVGAEKLYNLFKKLDNNSIDDFLEELACNFAMLYLNAAANTDTKHVYPYASVYLSENHLLYQEETEKVIKFYIENKVAQKKDFKEPEDHVAVELNFIALLTDNASKALLNNDKKLALKKLEVTKTFMEQHLLPWIHKFCIDLREAAPDDFYSSIADITLGFIRTDYNSLNDLFELIQ
jgi:TorA maturation chaperone TorD